MDNVPDNYDLFELYEAEQERLSRRRKQIEREWEEEEYDLPFVDVPQDYGKHENLY